MIQLFLSLLLIIIHIAIFIVLGTGLDKLLKLKLSGLETIIVGFFGYYGAIQLVYLPSLLLRVSFSTFMLLWILVGSALMLSITIYCNKEIVNCVNKIIDDINSSSMCLIVLAGIIVSGLVVYQALFNRHGLDAAFYIGTVSTTLYTDTMFIYQGETGRLAFRIDMRYALSGVFYMNTAFWCRLLNLHPLMAQKYTFGSLGIILHGIILYMMGCKLFDEDTSRKKAYLFTIVALLMNLIFFTGYNSSTFLLWRGFESKSYCVNVIFLAVFYIILCLWKSGGVNRYWKVLFIVSLASVPISMSSLVILPGMVFIFTVSEWVVKKDKWILLKGGVSLLPNGIYLVLFYMFLSGIWVIRI